jgi:thymidylate synthase
MKHIVAGSIQEGWIRLLHELRFASEYHPHPSGKGTREILGMRLEVLNFTNNIVYHKVRNLNYKFLVSEWLCAWFGRNDLKTTQLYSKTALASWAREDGILGSLGAYGPAFYSQWSYVINTLLKDRDSRQAVLTVWKPNPVDFKDAPCTISMQFLIRENRLTGIVNMRSSDVWLGLPLDFYMFSQFANIAAAQLGVEPGSLIMNLGSSHLYDTEAEKAIEVLDTPNERIVTSSPRLPCCPPSLLEQVLVSPHALAMWQSVSGLSEPWLTYAKVLQAKTWTDAYSLLNDGATPDFHKD